MVRTQTDRALIGLIAGYVNGKVHEIGVKGGTIVSGAKNTAPLEGKSFLSYYALIGDRDKNVNWGGVGIPGQGSNAGGAIRIDPNDTTTSAENPSKTLFQLALEDIQSDGYAAVLESLPGHSYFVGKNIVAGENVSPGTMYMYYKILTSSDTTIEQGSNKYISFTNANYESKAKDNLDANMQINSDFLTRLNDGGSNTIGFGSTIPNPNTTTSVTLPRR